MSCVFISHNHYDHLDTHTIKTLESLHKPHFFAPLGNDTYFKDLGIPKDRIHCLDWWDRRDITVDLPVTGGDSTMKATFAATCTPCQHFTGRGILDRFASLWSSWVIEDMPSYDAATPSTTETGNGGVKLWFAGDTGYRSVENGDNEDEVPVCPEFKNIGNKFGSFDLAFIPIG